jgi:hypothetical protein
MPLIPLPTLLRRRCGAILLAAALAVAVPGAHAADASGTSGAWDMTGTHAVLLHGRDGPPLRLGTVTFAAPGPDGRSGFTLALDRERFKDFFLSMKEFKCVEGPGEVFCHVPYPYPQPGTVGADDFAWLEHTLLFMFKTPGEFGAKLWNGVYFQLRRTATGLDGRPQAVDLNRISAPPDRPGPPPFRPALRDDIAPGARWFGRLTIE